MVFPLSRGLFLLKNWWARLPGWTTPCSAPVAPKPWKSRSSLPGLPHNGARSCPSSKPATGDERFSKIFLSDRPDEFSQVPFNDLDALEAVLRKRDVAAFIIETIPATYGFPMPKDGYLQACQNLCRKYGAMYIADEVQTGLMRTGIMWGW